MSAFAKSFTAASLRVTAPAALPKLPSMQGVKFGHLFAPLMFQSEFTPEAGWSTPEITPFGPLKIMPQMGCLHYGLQCFEGMKAYRDAKTGTVRMFRPDRNAARLQSSHKRLVFPEFDEPEWLKCQTKLVSLLKDWIPTEEGHSLYIRPTSIGTNLNLSVGPADRVLMYTICCPVGPYYPTGFKPVKLVAESTARRAFPGGTGSFKLGANYAGPIMHQVNYTKEGFQQILWLAPDGTMDEVGAMNFMVLWKNEQGERELITAPLDGTILPGVTRDSILTLTRQWGEFKVSERRVHIKSVLEALKAGRVEEMFGCGTAAIVSTVEALSYEGTNHVVPCPEASVAKRLMTTLLDIQTGKTPSPWSVIVE